MWELYTIISKSWHSTKGFILNVTIHETFSGTFTEAIDHADTVYGKSAVNIRRAPATESSPTS